jgi:hypothetical protein
LVDLGTRDHQGVALRHRLDGQEGDELVVLVDESARYFAVDDLGEDGGHGSTLSCRADAGLSSPKRGPLRLLAKRNAG